MELLGYEPEKFYPTGRASFEALAKGIPLHSTDLVFRCNTVTIDRDKQTLNDFTAGLISDSDARKLVTQIDLCLSTPGNFTLDKATAIFSLFAAPISRRAISGAPNRT